MHAGSYYQYYDNREHKRELSVYSRVLSCDFCVYCCTVPCTYRLISLVLCIRAFFFVRCVVVARWVQWFRSNTCVLLYARHARLSTGAASPMARLLQEFRNWRSQQEPSPLDHQPFEARSSSERSSSSSSSSASSSSATVVAATAVVAAVEVATGIAV